VTEDEHTIRELKARNRTAAERVAALQQRNAELVRGIAEMEAKIAASTPVPDLEAERDALESLLDKAPEER